MQPLLIPWYQENGIRIEIEQRNTLVGLPLSHFEVIIEAIVVKLLGV